MLKVLCTKYYNTKFHKLNENAQNFKAEIFNIMSDFLKMNNSDLSIRPCECVEKNVCMFDIYNSGVYVGNATIWLDWPTQYGSRIADFRFKPLKAFTTQELNILKAKYFISNDTLIVYFISNKQMFEKMLVKNGSSIFSALYDILKLDCMK